MNQHQAIILSPVLSCLLQGRSAAERSEGRCLMSRVLKYVEELQCCHWLQGVILLL